MKSTVLMISVKNRYLTGRKLDQRQIVTNKETVADSCTPKEPENYLNQ